VAHEITTREDGTAEAAFALEPAWHGLGVVLDHPMTSQEALTAARLDWQVVQRPVAVGVPETIETPEGQVEAIRYHDIPGMLANVRADNGTVLGTVSDAYKVIQNTEAFSFLDGLIADHAMQYESAFSLSGGKRVVLLGKLPKVDEIVRGDETLRYVLLSLHHDGGGAIRFGPTAVRVVCANTYAMALGRGTIGDLKADDFSREVAIRHMGDVKVKLEAARQILVAANQQFDAHAEASRKLAESRMTAAEWDAYLDLMCPRLDPRDPDYTEKRAARIADTRKAICMAHWNDRQTLPGIQETAWAAYNAVAEHIDHLPRRGATRERKAEARFSVCLYGPGRDMKRRAFEAACRFAGIAT
jgi:phage/plasmid-like protein (TIGR03299 family)